MEVRTRRKCWRLTELPEVTGLSLSYWRKVHHNKELRTRKVGRAVVVLEADLNSFLSGESAGGNDENPSVCADAA